MATETERNIPISTGHEKYVEISERWSGPALLTMRLLLGWHFFFAGITKVLDPGWSASGFLLNAIPDGNPFAGLWPVLANEWLWLIDPLNQWGLTLVGLALILGVAVRWSAFWGSIMMWFYWAASLPLAHSVFVDDHIVYIALLFALGAFGAGRYYGLDRYLENTAVVRNNAWLKYLLG